MVIEVFIHFRENNSLQSVQDYHMIFICRFLFKSTITTFQEEPLMSENFRTGLKRECGKKAFVRKKSNTFP